MLYSPQYYLQVISRPFLRHTKLIYMRLKQQFREATQLLGSYPAKTFAGEHPHPAERDIIILYGLWNGWNASSIGKYCRLGAVTVRKHINRLRSRPGNLFVLPILSRILIGGRHAFRCEFCGDTQFENDVTEENARLHVARHVTTEEYIQTYGVRGSGYHGM